MDISGLVRTALRETGGGGAAPDSAATDPIGEIAQVVAAAVAFPERRLEALPRALRLPSEGGINLTQEIPTVRPVYRWLALASLLRILPRVTREGDRGGARETWADALRAQVKPLAESAQKLLASRTSRPVELLWHHWLLLLAKKQLGIDTPDLLATGLWRRAVALQPKAGGPLTPPTADTLMDAWIYDELCSLHAAFNAIVVAQAWDKMPVAESLVHYHVQHTQPDHTTTEPWALAAFASLDDTTTFAPQQLHDARAQSISTPIARLLLADSVLTHEAIG